MSDSRQLKATPYGDANFVAIRSQGFAYVDKTRCIEVLERCKKYPFIVRPRRFGKTLSTNMLQAYYDEAAAGQFDQVFLGTYIGSHKTPLANKFRVLHLDFSGIATSSHAVMESAFQKSVLYSLGDYFIRYPHPEQNKILEGRFEDAASLIGCFFLLVSQNDPGVRLYILIDEYDQFANEVLSEDLNHFQAITSAKGFLKTFFAKLKSATSQVVERIFITGVTSISLDSMTSGFSISSNYTTDPAFADLYGFTEGELRELASQVLDLNNLACSLDELVSRMKEWYNGYRFSPQNPATVFNPTMCLGYLEAWLRLGEEPETLLDPNAGYDINKIEKILRLGDEDFVKQIVAQALRREPISLKGGLRTLDLNQQSQFDRASLLSAMFYFGFLTYGPGPERVLVVPNRAVSIQFFEFFLKHVLQAEDYEFVATEFIEAIKALVAGDPRPLFEVTCNRFQAASGLHSHAHLKESDFQTLLIGAFNFSNAYVVKSEAELDGEAKGFADILATPAAESRAETAYLVEVKYLSTKAATGEAKAQALVKAREQISRYEKADNVKCLPKVKRIVALFVGLKLDTLEIY